MITQTNTQKQQIEDRLPPCNIEAEESIIGGILLDPNAIGRIADFLPIEAFYVTPYREIYAAALNLHKKGEPTDLIVVSEYLQSRNKLEKIGGLASLAMIVDRTVGSVNIDRYANLVLEKYARRQLIDKGEELKQIAKSDYWDSERLLEVVEKQLEEIKGYQDILSPKVDRSYDKYLKLVAQVKAIQQGITDPGHKLLKMAELSKTTGHAIHFLENLYLKYLASSEIEPMMTIAEMKAKYGQDVQEWFLHGFGPKGSVVLVHAHGGAGKTRLCYDWIHSMVTGQPWGGIKATDQNYSQNDSEDYLKFQVTAKNRRVLIVQTDESQGDMLNAFESRGLTSDMPIRCVTRWSADHMAALRANIESFQPDVILIDSLTSINRNSMFSENDTEYARPVLELRDIAQEFGCLIYLIHHSNSEGGSRGTKAIAASVSHVFGLARPSNGSDPRTLQRVLCIEKSRSRAPAKYELVFNPDTGGWLCKGLADDSKGEDSSIKTRITDYLSENRNIPYTSYEIYQSLGGSEGSVRRALTELGNDGEICRKKKGKAYLYWLADDDAAKTIIFPETVPDETPIPSDHDPSDQLMISCDDQLGNPDTATVSEVTDHVITENQNFQKIENSKKSNFDDQMISKSHNQDTAKVIPTDHPTDHQLITPDHDQQNRTEKPIGVPPAHTFEMNDAVVVVSDSLCKREGKMGFISYVYPTQVEVTWYEDNQKPPVSLFHPSQLERIK